MSATRTRVIGTCRIQEPLAEGGMAAVYRALQEPLQRPVAVKVMKPELARNKEAVTRFRREALALASLQHQNVVAIHDMVEKNDQLFMVMELVDGVDLATLLDDGPLPLDVALIVARGVAAALEHAHFRKVLHRDVKPGNVMVSRLGVVKLTDFGIAKDLDIDDLTRTGFVVGTPNFLAPEVLRGHRPDHRADIYALGVLLFEALTAQKPFQATGQGDLFAAIIKGDRKRLRQVRRVPRDVDAIVERCMQVDPDQRFARASELRAALDAALARRLRGGAAARMVSFLQARGRLRADDLTALDGAELTVARPTRARARGRLVRVGGVATLGVGAGLAAAFWLAPGQALNVAEAVLRWVWDLRFVLGGG